MGRDRGYHVRPNVFINWFMTSAAKGVISTESMFYHIWEHQHSCANYFSKLDAAQGFWQIKLDDESSRYCTFKTPFGRYRFLRMPFGIISASEIYHCAMDNMLDSLEGVRCYVDDVVVYWNVHTQPISENISTERTSPWLQWVQVDIEKWARMECSKDHTDKYTRACILWSCRGNLVMHRVSYFLLRR